MKKLVLTTVCALAMVGGAYAQNVSWFSFSPGVLFAHTNGATYSPLFGGGPTAGGTSGTTATAETGGAPNYYYELLYGGTFTAPLTGSSVPSNNIAALFGGTWLDTGLGGTNGTAVSGVVQAIAPTTGASVPWNAGTTDNIVLVGWSANLGTSWGVVSNELATGSYASLPAFATQEMFFGVSQAGFISSAAGNPGNTVFAAGTASYGQPINGTTFTMYELPPVPEPTTLALAGLGGLSLLMFRRRKV